MMNSVQSIQETNSKPLSFVYLASQSPRRAQLLEQIGIEHKLLLPQSDLELQGLEILEEISSGESPKDYVTRVTQLKLDAALIRLQKFRNSQLLESNGSAQTLYQWAPVLCADTTVALDGRILGKPQSQLQAKEMLTLLSGRVHQVLTAVAIGLPAQTLQAPSSTVAALSVSLVEFAALSPNQIESYVLSGESKGKAGAYAVQGRAAGFIKKIEGSYSGIMGLPLFEVTQLLTQLGCLNV